MSERYIETAQCEAGTDKMQREIDALQVEIEQLQAENERLRGLVENAFNEGWDCGFISADGEPPRRRDDLTRESDWLSSGIGNHLTTNGGE